MWDPSTLRRRTIKSGRLQVTRKPWRFPEGALEVENVVASLVRAREVAMRRKAAVEARLAKEAREQSDGGGHPEPAEGEPVSEPAAD